MKLTCVVDNTVARGSSLWGEHGLCFLVETMAGNVLWDVGQHTEVLTHNLSALHLDGLPIEAMALSHAHYDHTGALLPFLQAHPGLRIHANARLFERRFSRRNDELRSIGLHDARGALVALADFRLSDDPQAILPSVCTTGAITRRPFPLGSSRGHLVARDGKLIPDPYADDMSLVLETTQGIILLCGCCHAGLRNTISTVCSQHTRPLLAIVGGTHLAGADQTELDRLSDTLEAVGRPRLYLNHCTGEKAIMDLSRRFGDLVHPCPCGTVLEFA